MSFSPFSSDSSSSLSDWDKNCKKEPNFNSFGLFWVAFPAGHKALYAFMNRKDGLFVWLHLFLKLRLYKTTPFNRVKFHFWNCRSFSSSIRRRENRGNFKTWFFLTEWSCSYIVLALVRLRQNSQRDTKVCVHLWILNSNLCWMILFLFIDWDKNCKEEPYFNSFELVSHSSKYNLFY